MTEQLNYIEELGITLDVMNRTILYLVGKTCAKNEIEAMYKMINALLCEQYGSDKTSPLIKTYEAAAMQINQAFAKEL